MSFKDRLKEARLSKKLTQEQLGELIGVAKSTITGYEKGNSEPDMMKLQKLMTVLDVDANFLLQDEMITSTVKKVLSGEGNRFFSSPCEKEFTEIFSNLAPETQQYLLLMARELLNTQQKLLNPSGNNNKETKETTQQMTVEEAEAEYIKSRSKFARNAEPSALNTIEGTDNKRAG